MDNSGKLLGAQINREWFLYQEKEVFAEYRQKRLTIGLPNETERRENRVCLTPEAVAMMVDMGHTIMIQRGAGEAAHYHDREYADAGAQMLDTCEEVYIFLLIRSWSTPPLFTLLNFLLFLQTSLSLISNHMPDYGNQVDINLLIYCYQ